MYIKIDINQKSSGLSYTKKNFFLYLNKNVTLKMKYLKINCLSVISDDRPTIF